MATHMTTILPRATEAPRGDTSSLIATLFSQLNGALPVAINAERDLGHCNGRDPAIDPWLRKAEHAWGVVSDLRQALHDAPVTCASDLALLSMARIADAVMDSDNVLDFGAADNRLRAATFFRRTLGRGHVPDHIGEMLDACHAHLRAVTHLDLYQPVCDPGDLPDGLLDWPEAC